ncbi:MAG: tRNA lysidine(34) synthetase TilS [Verrucomicrobiae bacterium]|nr:tRNA lysidine(34) synthetase TilS [Verrucomicrobiae bacterium]
MNALAAHVRVSLTRHGLLPAGGRILVAVSGGADSMMLLHLLHTLAGPLRLELAVAHAHHQLRGSDADLDARLVRMTARALGLRCVMARLPVREARGLTGESLEMAARRLRHAFLARTARRLGMLTVALAHHADDQAELVLMRLLQGAGGDGLAGMSWQNPSSADRRIVLIRPLLDLPGSRLKAAAIAGGVPFREDASNSDPGPLRNRVRLELLPLLEARFSPAIRRLLGRTADLVGAEATFVGAEAQRWLEHPQDRDFRVLPLALQRAVLRVQLRALGHEPGFDTVERLRRGVGVHQVSEDLRVRRDAGGRVVPESPVTVPDFEGREQRLELRSRGGTATLGGTSIRYSFDRAASFSPDNRSAGEEVFDAARVGMRICLRHWRPGDRFQPLGFARPAKLQDLLVNRKVPAARRRTLLVAATGDGILFWVESLPPGDLFRIRPDTRRTLRWKWRPVP